MKTKVKALSYSTVFLLVLLTGVFVVSGSCAAKTIFTDDFESYSYGSLGPQSLWMGNASVANGGVAGGEKAVRIYQPYPGVFYAERTGDSVNDGQITIYISRLVGITSNPAVEVQLKEGSKVIASARGIIFFKYFDGNTDDYTAFSSERFNSEVWYALQMQWRSSDHKIRYNINGGQWTDWAHGLDEWANGIDTLRVAVSNGIGFFDNVQEDLLGIKKKNPVLIVPGLLGTEMKKGEELLWADAIRMTNPFNSDSFMDPLQFNENLNPVDSSLAIGNILGSPFVGYHFYDLLITELINQGYTENETLFTFPYDWRYGVSGVYADGKTNVDLLKQKIDDILQETGANEVDVVAHSLGGLIVKKYAMDNPTNNHIGKAVFVGVPNTGAPKAVKVLLQGDNFGVLGLNDSEIKKIAENMPAAYDLLPTQEYYADNGAFVKTVNVDVGNLIYEENDLDYQQSKTFITDEHNFNSQGMTNAENLHANAFDNFDLRTAGIDLYSINGCKSGTINKITETTKTDVFGYTTVNYDIHKIGAGDGTVPLSSAENLLVDDANVFYAKYADHGKMPSQSGIKEKIVNIVSGTSLNTGNNIITKSEVQADPNICELNGFWLWILSPVLISATDQNNNRAGIAEDGSVQNQIPGADYQIIGDHAFVFIPTDENQTYAINLKGEDTGTFTLKNSKITDGQTIQTEVFSNLPVTAELSGQVVFSGSAGQPTTLVLDNDGNGSVDQTIEPSFIYEGEEPKDTQAPEAIIEFDPTIKDLKFSAKDSSPATVIDNDDSVILTDDAGNATEITLKDKNRKRKMKAEIKEIKYNNIPADLTKNQMQFSWNLDKKTQDLKNLRQHIKLKNNYNITATYNNNTNQTKIAGRDETGKIKETLEGLKIIKITTNRGDLFWRY